MLYITSTPVSPYLLVREAELLLNTRLDALQQLVAIQLRGRLDDPYIEPGLIVGNRHERCQHRGLQGRRNPVVQNRPQQAIHFLVAVQLLGKLHDSATSDSTLPVCGSRSRYSWTALICCIFGAVNQ